MTIWPMGQHVRQQLRAHFRPQALSQSSPGKTRVAEFETKWVVAAGGMLHWTLSPNKPSNKYHAFVWNKNLAFRETTSIWRTPQFPESMQAALVIHWMHKKNLGGIVDCSCKHLHVPVCWCTTFLSCSADLMKPIQNLFWTGAALMNRHYHHGSGNEKPEKNRE